MFSSIFSIIEKESSRNEVPQNDTSGVVTAFNTAEVQILQEYPVSPAAPVEPTKAKEVEPPRSVLSKRKIFTVEFKRKVIDYMSCVKSSPCSAISNTMRFFSVQDITEFNINNFMRKENFAKIMKCSSDQQKKFKIKERKSDYPTIEAKLLEFFEASVCATGNKKGWMTGKTMILFMYNVIYPYIQQHGHICWTLDNCTSHNIEKILQQYETDYYQVYLRLNPTKRNLDIEKFIQIMRSHCHIIYVPKNTTPQNQVLDVSVNGPFKAYLRGIHHRYCVREHNKILNANAHVGHIPEEANIKIPPPQRRNSYFQIMETISLIDPSVVIHGFEKIQILTTSTTKTPPNLYVARGGQQILGFAEFSHQRTFWNCCVNENNIGIDQILFPKDVDIVINDDEDEEDEAFVFDDEEENQNEE